MSASPGPTRRNLIHLTERYALVLPTRPFVAAAHASSDAPAPPPSGAAPLTVRGSFDVTVGEGLAAARARLGHAFDHADFQRWRVPPRTTWAQVTAHYTAALGSGWSANRLPDTGDLRVQEWTRGWLRPQRFAVGLLDRVIETPEGACKVLYVAIPVAR